jgi:hypothetical protein
MDSAGSGQQTVADFWNHDNGPSNNMKSWECLHWQSDYQLLKAFAP